MRDLDAFVTTPGFACAVGADAPLVIAESQIADPAIIDARVDAVARAAADQLWKKTIVKAMKAGLYAGLPNLRDVEANAQHGALTTAMALGWRIAVDAGVMTQANYRAAMAAQVEAIASASALPSLSADTRQSLAHLHNRYAVPD